VLDRGQPAVAGGAKPDPLVELSTMAATRWHFTDSSHFIRSFKRQFHTTPAQFARRG
jgi:hypothetical protein